MNKRFNREAIYLDYNATTPLDPAVSKVMRPFLDENIGNPSSSHSFGVTARGSVDRARRQVAKLLECTEEEIIFMSGGTESNNLALIGTALANRNKGCHIITTQIEHPAILEAGVYLESIGFTVSYVGVDAQGRVDPSDIERSISKETILISVMHANNEVGTVQPIKEISKIAHSHNVIMHTDAAQSIGKIRVSINELNVDLLSIAGHKIYAPKGIGALFIREGTPIHKIIHGAGQECGLRPGTENVMAIAGLGIACELIVTNLPEYAHHMRKNRNFLEEELIKVFPEVVINGHPTYCLPNTLSTSFLDIPANLILESMQGVAASAGAACHSNDVKISHVLTAIGIPEHIAMGTIRFSVGRFNTNKEIEHAIPLIKKAVATARYLSE
jgi:cysteine desulfurase